MSNLINTKYVAPATFVGQSNKPKPEIYKGEAKDLKEIYDKYTEPYKNTPKGIHITTTLDLTSGKKAREALIAVEDRLKELGVDYLA